MTSVIFFTPLQAINVEKVLWVFPFQVRVIFYKDQNGDRWYLWEYIKKEKGKFKLANNNPEKERGIDAVFNGERKITIEDFVKEIEQREIYVDISQYFGL